MFRVKTKIVLQARRALINATFSFKILSLDKIYFGKKRGSLIFGGKSYLPNFSMKKTLLFISLFSISSLRAVSKRNGQQTELKEELSIAKTWSVIVGGASFVLVVSYLYFLKKSHDNNEFLKACKAKDAIKVKDLMGSRWVDINAKDMYDDAALHLAVSRGSLEIVDLLLNHPKINVNITTIEGDTPLHLSVYQDSFEIINRLLAHKNTKLDVQNIEGETPISLVKSKQRFVSGYEYDSILELMEAESEEE